VRKSSFYWARNGVAQPRFLKTFRAGRVCAQQLLMGHENLVVIYARII